MTSPAPLNGIQITQPDPVPVRAILLDVEGTTTPIAFVHEVLFPFARTHIGDYLRAHAGTTDTHQLIADLEQEHANDMAQQHDPPTLIDGPKRIESIIAYVQWLIDRDRKSTVLKSLQGKIWRSGYVDGSLKAPIFGDVAPALARWRSAGLEVGIFSSGSILAQQLLFAHTEVGDLTHLIDYYFDTTTGSKTASNSYKEIAVALSRSTQEILFISDVMAELGAASTAGMQTLLCVRPGNHFRSTGPNPQIRSFDEVPLPAGAAEGLQEPVGRDSS